MREAGGWHREDEVRVRGRENKVWKGLAGKANVYTEGRDGQGEGEMKGKCAMFVCPRGGSPSARPHVCGRGWILPRDNNKKRSRALEVP